MSQPKKQAQQPETNQTAAAAAGAKVAVIIVDSGFAPSSVTRVKNLLGYLDLNSGIAVVGKPMVEGQARELVLSMAQDNLNHGTIILERLLALDPDLPLVLVRGFAPEGGLIRTVFEQGKIARDGWTEAYLWAQNLCAEKGYLTVANFSFGGFHHALDGSGWESFQLSRVVGAGKPGHLLAAAAGPGDDRAIHACLSLQCGGSEVVHADQDGTTTYNLWVNRLCAESEAVDFDIEVKINGQTVFTYHGQELKPNLWNGKQQITFAVPGSGAVEIFLARATARNPGDHSAARFDLYVSREGGEAARFSDFIDHELVCEPAVLSEVIAVGLKDSTYGKSRIMGIDKPEVLLDGYGPISFRTPEITFALSRMLAQDPSLDLPAARARLHRS